MPKYLSYLQTGSGSDHIEIQIEGDIVEINVRRHWMGSGLTRYKLTCRRHALSGSFGLFTVESVEAAVGADASFSAVTVDEEQMLLPWVIEYVTVPSSPVYVHEQSQLVAMRPLGYATWHDSFELVLMVHDFEGRASQQPIADICDTLDKKKFTEWSAQAEKDHAERAAKDAETSLANCNAILGGK